jgi:hypothetical protein
MRALADDAPRRHRCREPRELALLHRLAAEEAAHQAVGGAGDDDAVGLGERLQPRGEIGRRADDEIALMRMRGEEVADDHHPGRHADPHRGVVAARQLEPADLGGDLMRGAHRALGVVLVRHGMAEIGEDAVADEARDEALVARDRAAGERAVAAQRLEHVLGLQPLGERGRADHVAEHHRHRPPLEHRGRRGRARRRLDRLAHSAQQTLALAQRKAELAQIVLGQILQRVESDVLLREERRELGELGVVQPALDGRQEILRRYESRHRSHPSFRRRSIASPAVAAHSRAGEVCSSATPSLSCARR